MVNNQIKIDALEKVIGKLNFRLNELDNISITGFESHYRVEKEKSELNSLKEILWEIRNDLKSNENNKK